MKKRKTTIVVYDDKKKFEEKVLAAMKRGRILISHGFWQVEKTGPLAKGEKPFMLRESATFG